VTYIGHRLGTQFNGDDIYRIPPVMDDKALRVSHFIRISKQLTKRRVRYYWIFIDIPERELPIHSSISFGDDRTWQLEYIIGDPADVPPPQPSAPPTDTTMEDILSSSTQPPPRSLCPMTGGSPSHPTLDPYMQDILQHLQGTSL
jgi:hypothetical protein